MNIIKNYYFYSFFILIIFPMMHGCAALFVGTAATGASIATDRRTLGTIVEDQAIELKASKALYADVVLRERAHINVTSYNTVVLVTGEVPNAEDRDRVTDIIKNIPKVSQVHNEITIAAPSAMVLRTSDTLITSNLKLKFFAAKELQANKIKIVTEKGVVYLMGVLKQQEGDIATDIARKVKGVQKVVKLFQYVD